MFLTIFFSNCTDGQKNSCMGGNGRSHGIKESPQNWRNDGIIHIKKRNHLKVKFSYAVSRRSDVVPKLEKGVSRVVIRGSR